MPTGAVSGCTISQKCRCGQGSVPDPTDRAYSTPPDPLPGFDLRGPLCGKKRKGGRERKGRV